MRTMTGEQFLVRVFFGESDKWHHQSLGHALVEELRKAGLAGATLFRGIAGFGAHSVVHSMHLLEISADLPMVLEIVESEERVTGTLMPLLERMLDGGLVTTERVQVTKYAPHTRPK